MCSKIDSCEERCVRYWSQGDAVLTDCLHSTTVNARAFDGVAFVTYTTFDAATLRNTADGLLAVVPITTWRGCNSTNRDKLVVHVNPPPHTVPTRTAVLCTAPNANTTHANVCVWRSRAPHLRVHDDAQANTDPTRLQTLGDDGQPAAAASTVFTASLQYTATRQWQALLYQAARIDAPIDITCSLWTLVEQYAARYHRLARPITVDVVTAGGHNMSVWYPPHIVSADDDDDEYNEMGHRLVDM